MYQRSGRKLWLHPLLTGSIVIALALKLLNVDYTDYKNANWLFYQLLGLATVSLALPLHREFHQLKGLFLPITGTIALGSGIACATALAFAYVAGAGAELLLALAPKSVTTPIALGIAEAIGANTSLTTGVVIFTGVIGALISPMVFKLTGLTDPRGQGIVLGINAHGVGTARGFEVSATVGVFASLAMGLTGAFTALWLPFLAGYF
ncbi:LrgB family protein [Simiduia litorea]